MLRRIVVGEVAAPFGVKGWIKVQSYTDPPQNILNYSPWFIGAPDDAECYKVIDGKPHGSMIVASLDGVTDRDEAARLRSRLVSVERGQFPPPAPDEFYWADMIGLEVHTTDGVVLGRVADMIETGANDVVVVRGERERLIPFVQSEFVKQVDLDKGVMIVDWDPDF